MTTLQSQRLLRVFLYGGGSALLLLDIFFLIRASFTGSFVPIVPILAGIFTAAGLLLIVYAEQRARVDDRKNHRRISRVAHQLETPLNKLTSDLARMIKNADKLPAEERLQLKHMETSTTALLDNIRDLFLTLQAQEGRISQDVRTYDLCQLLTEAVKRAQPLASAKNVELISKAHCATAPVIVDRHLLLIALSHVIDNAIHYTRPPGLVNIALTRGKKHTRIIVQDRGIGIRDQDTDAVFLPFARGTDAHQYDPHGIGLGLALTRLILREVGATITHRPKPHGTGSEFVIRLPLAAS